MVSELKGEGLDDADAPDAAAEPSSDTGVSSASPSRQMDSFKDAGQATSGAPDATADPDRALKALLQRAHETDLAAIGFDAKTGLQDLLERAGLTEAANADPEAAIETLLQRVRDANSAAKDYDVEAGLARVKRRAEGGKGDDVTDRATDPDA